jgi:hypothetical protein
VAAQPDGGPAIAKASVFGEKLRDEGHYSDAAILLVEGEVKRFIEDLISMASVNARIARLESVSRIHVERAIHDIRVPVRGQPGTVRVTTGGALIGFALALVGTRLTESPTPVNPTLSYIVAAVSLVVGLALITRGPAIAREVLSGAGRRLWVLLSEISIRIRIV